MATNSKISDLNPVKTPLQTGDLLAVVQTENGNSETRRATFGNLLGSIVAPGSTSRLVYPDSGETAIEAKVGELAMYDSQQNSVINIKPNQASIALHTKDDSGNINSDFTLTGQGLRFSRVDVNPTTKATSAWQIRLDSDDTYLNSKNDVEISAGSVSNEPTQLTSLAALSGGRLRLFSGGTMDAKAKGTIKIESQTYVQLDSLYPLSSVDTDLGTSIQHVKKEFQNMLLLKDGEDGLELTSKYVTTTTSTDKATSVTKKISVLEDVRNRLVFTDSGSAFTTQHFTLSANKKFDVLIAGGNHFIFDTDNVIALNNVVSNFSNVFQEVYYATTVPLPNCVVDGSVLKCTTTDALVISGYTFYDGTLLFVNAENATDKQAFNGICRINYVDSHWQITKVATPYMVGVTSTYAGGGVYVRRSSTEETVVAYEKM